MARYIDAEQIDFSPIKDDFDRARAVTIVKFQPTADVVEVVQGEWQIKSEIHRFMEEVDEDFYVECPFCKRVYYVPFEFEDEKMLEYAKEHYPYCNCGAKMDGERKKNDKE